MLKHGSLAVAAMVGGGGMGSPGGTTMTGSSTGSAGGTGGAVMMSMSVQLRVAAEQLPVPAACDLTTSYDNSSYWKGDSPAC